MYRRGPGDWYSPTADSLCFMPLPREELSRAGYLHTSSGDRHVTNNRLPGVVRVTEWQTWGTVTDTVIISDIAPFTDNIQLRSLWLGLCTLWLQCHTLPWPTSVQARSPPPHTHTHWPYIKTVTPPPHPTLSHRTVPRYSGRCWLVGSSNPVSTFIFHLTGHELLAQYGQPACMQTTAWCRLCRLFHCITLETKL